MKEGQRSILIIFLILLADQVLKIIIKTNMFLYQDIHVSGNWFIIKFIENDGMAFGYDIPGAYGKPILSIFRILAVIGIGFYLRHLIKIKSHKGLLIAVSVILAGAIGNIIDSLFYGMIFTESTPYAKAVMFPPEGGYSGFLYGKVVDMFYFPLISGYYPSWVPFVGGQSFEFFRPVFNIADSSITMGVFVILIFQKRFFKEETDKKVEKNTDGTDKNG